MYHHGVIIIFWCLVVYHQPILKDFCCLVVYDKPPLKYFCCLGGYRRPPPNDFYCLVVYNKPPLKDTCCLVVYNKPPLKDFCCLVKHHRPPPATGKCMTIVGITCFDDQTGWRKSINFQFYQVRRRVGVPVRKAGNQPFAATSMKEEYSLLPIDPERFETRPTTPALR